MKIRMISLSLAALFGFAGATSAFAQNYDDSYEWIRQSVASKEQVKTDRIANTAPQATNDGSTPCTTPCH